MHRAHIDSLLAVLPNLKHAVHDRETLRIGGGEFAPDVALSLSVAVEYALRQQRDHGSEADRAYLTPRLKG